MELLNILIENKYIAILISLIGTLYWLWQKIRNELNEKKKELMDKILTTQPSVDSFKAEIEQKLTHSPSLYKVELSNVLGFLERHLEPLKIFSSIALSKHLIISGIYSLIFFYLAWLFGANGQIGNHNLISGTNKVGLTFFLISFSIIIYFALTRHQKIHDYFLKRRPRIVSLPVVFKDMIAGLLWVIELTLYGSIVIIVGTLTLKDDVDVSHDAIVSLVIILTIVIAFVKIVNDTRISLLILLALIFYPIVLPNIFSYLELEDVNRYELYIICVFSVILFINAFFDYLSMIASRFFAQNILKTHKKMTIFWDIVWDLLIALALFVGLALTLFYLLDFVNHAFIKEEALFVPIEHYKSLLLSRQIFHPDVLWITLMFVSTLIPTFIHLYLFVYSLMAFMLVQPHLHHVVETLDKLDLENHHQKELVAYDLADYRLTNYLRVHIGFMVALSIVFVVVLWMVISKINFSTLI